LVLALALTCSLLTAGAESQHLKLASPGLSYVNIPEKTGDFFTDTLAQRLQAHGIQVITQAQMAAVLGLEQQRRMLSCASTSSGCVAELAGALGVDAIITGSLAKLDSGYAINLSIVAANDAHSIAIFSERAKNDDALMDLLGRAADLFASRLGPAARAGKEVAPPAEARVEVSAAEGSGLRGKAWIPAVAAGALTIGAIVLFADAASTDSALKSGSSGITDVNGAVSRGNLDQTLGWTCAGVAVAGLAVAGAMFVWGAPEHAQVMVAPTPNGAMVGFGGRFR
jgi:hypothetical protein